MEFSIFPLPDGQKPVIVVVPKILEACHCVDFLTQKVGFRISTEITPSTISDLLGIFAPSKKLMAVRL